MDFNIYNKEDCFNYSVISEKMIGTLYKVRKKIPLERIDYKHIGKGKEILNLILDGKLIESGKKDFNSISNNNLFIYDYGSTAINSLKKLNESEEIVKYLKDLDGILANVENSDIKDIEFVEDFFDTIGELLDKDIEESKYIIQGNQKDIFSNWNI